MFSKNKYQVCKNMISKELCDFVFNVKNEKTNFLFIKKNRSRCKVVRYRWRSQAPGTYSCYSDIAMETLLTIIHSKLEKKQN